MVTFNKKRRTAEFHSLSPIKFGTAATNTADIRQMETACVTGATGFLGSELVAQLLQGGYKVHASVRSLANTERNGCLLSLPGAHSARLTLFEADLLDEGAFDGCVAGARYVFHTASPFVTSNISDPELQLIAPALNGTRNVFGSIGRSIAMGAAPPRVVLTSSVAAVMGTPADKVRVGVRVGVRVTVRSCCSHPNPDRPTRRAASTSPTGTSRRKQGGTRPDTGWTCTATPRWWPSERRGGWQGYKSSRWRASYPHSLSARRARRGQTARAC